ncbi:chemotaxis protein CheW [Paremcibacter congregatus]|uniref:Chemotaxis protein CheW n=1 Tax=Paremcibacter congregatus TaxID=2043170 RepID=A0A2G4YSK7_9PROT|nr:chemotaxis protein CheW [Paremcibacter congregatus]PHZ85240.1 chemotaxis protein CheW [Paremcibacter congregatus]QDE27826.1 chemotaxis protein CheW [Paremcibacter congregatus]
MENTNKDFVTIRLAGQLCGVPVLTVHDVLSEQMITSVPLAPSAVEGVLNLRGRIVTAINLRKRLGLGVQDTGNVGMSIVVEYNGEPYSLLIDSVGDVMSFPDESFERNPVTLDQRWQEVSSGIYRMDGELLVILDVEKLLNFGKGQAAAA